MGTEKEEPDCQKQFQAAVSVIQNLPKNGEPVQISILGFTMVGLRPRDEMKLGLYPANVDKQVPP
jgi:hypothetical protein